MFNLILIKNAFEPQYLTTSNPMNSISSMGTHGWNFDQSLVPHMVKDHAIVDTLDQANWRLPALLGLAYFNFGMFLTIWY